MSASAVSGGMLCCCHCLGSRQSRNLCLFILVADTSVEHRCLYDPQHFICVLWKLQYVAASKSNFYLAGCLSSCFGYCRPSERKYKTVFKAVRPNAAMY